MVQEKIIEMLAEKLECETSEIAPDTTFAELGIDSLDVAELVMNLEDEFGVSLEMDASLNTVAAVTAKIEELKAEV
ncbi:MAG: acyl carrier protein [Ruminococcaceae bacterium]|nr:acyl carrier protein [Oscillospiraceae bacterium]